MSQQAPPYAPIPQQPGWMARNRLWFIPLVLLGFGIPVCGCGGCLIVPLVLVGGWIRSSEVYVDAMQRLNNSPEVTERLGTPIVAGTWGYRGSLDIQNDGGSAELHFPISGPKGSGTVDVLAYRENSVWTISLLQVQVKGQTEPIIVVDGQ